MSCFIFIGAMWDYNGTGSCSKEGSGNFKCPDCFKCYKYRSGLYTHRKLDCGKEPQFQCNICYKKFTRKDTLATHTIYKHRSLMVSYAP
ncbi:gastrula zinc finger protein XlCGF46.1 [Nilaparvata lugens]|uniref:gastrula zinc finger protein XlCGF46.1 n=1 Tax=Nilaparvata lugens TaxID=108931 RepID=UPI00193D2C1A|nr:gastrula zinc finger protein XlCGF46.1 [Nilaparvata lugens]